MTGRDLILYILSNNLENEPIFKNGKFIGFITVPEAAVKLNVGVNTIYALIAQNQLDYILIDRTYLINADCNIKMV